VRERIIDALSELSEARGFYNVTMDELSERAGMSKRTVYRYFTGKEEIIEAVLDEFMATVAAGIEDIVQGEKNIVDMFAELVKHLARPGGKIGNPLVLRDLRVHYPHFWHKIEGFRAAEVQRFIHLAMVKNNLAWQVNPQIFMTVFLAAVQAVVNPDFILDQGLTFNEVTGQLVELFSYGLVGRNGLCLMNGNIKG